jgi:solute carrier family 13 (sodium-dependent dicarboxylate transporter), member 2/3/5
MRTVHEAIGAVETYSPAEERFNRRRRTVGLLLAPIVFGAVLLTPIPGLPAPAHRQAAVMLMVIVLWVTEALPMAVTAVLGPILAVVLQVAPARAALAPFADPIIFLFIGSFMLAEAMFVHRVDRRIAFTALASPWVGSSAIGVLVAFGAVTTFISMWISNTATTAMMFPIGLSIVAHLARTSPDTDATRRFALGMMLITAFGASVGGMATPVGTPPNLIGIGLIERIAGRHIDFFSWMAIGVPLVLVLFLFLATWFGWWSARGVEVGQGSVAMVREELKKLGPVSVGQRNVLIAFGVTVLLWTAPGFIALLGLGESRVSRWYQAALPEGVAAMIGAILLFLLPLNWRNRQFTLKWEEAVRIDWGIVLLYGGGLALGELAFTTGLARWIGESLTAWLPSQSTFGLSVLFAALALVLSEATSNTASANMIVPVAMAVSQAAGVDPVQPALAATLAASMGFIMPISTAPNAIVYSSGYIPITAMMRHGAVLDCVAFVLIVLFVTLLAPIAIG